MVQIVAPLLSMAIAAVAAFVSFAAAPHARAADVLASGAIDDGGKLALQLDRLAEGGEVVSGFGWRRHPMGGGGAHHDGVDIKARRGAPVRVPWAGTVGKIAWGKNLGRYVVVRHPDGVETVYAHLGRVPRMLKAGQRVTEDEVIGFVGSTGRSTGPHLHFELHRDGKPIDPVTGQPRRPLKKARPARR
jgi:murein DD-endopeptidase MepM/ murein hydrolase activator NlpD